ncbi:MAG: DMT family transporter [Luminiphilus sp.]|nr:DMT family transporter [Luminiphilus sp.]
MTGPRYMLLSALAFALMGAMVKIASAEGLPLLQIIFVRAIISVLLCLIAIRRGGSNPLGRQRGLLLARGVVGFLALTGVFYAFINLPYAQATVLQYLHPVFTAGLAFWFLAERPTPATLICIALSILGLGCVVYPYIESTSAAMPMTAVLAGLAGAFGSGVAYTLVRKLAATEHPSVIVLYFPMVCVPATLLLGASDFHWPNQMGWLALLGVGCFTQLGQISLTKAMQTDSASKATSLSYLQIVFAAVLGWFVFDEIPATATLIGATFILLGALISAGVLSKLGSRVVPGST